MADQPRMTSTLYDYSDKSVSHAVIAAIVYGAMALASALLEWLQFILYHTPGGDGGFIIAGSLSNGSSIPQCEQQSHLSLVLSWPVFPAFSHSAFSGGVRSLWC